MTVTTHVMQCSSNELSTLASDSAKCKQTKLDIYALIPKVELSRRLGLGVCHQPDLKLSGFRSQLGVSRVYLATLKSCDTTKQSVSG